MSFLYRLPLSNFPSAIIFSLEWTPQSLSSEPVGVLGQSPSLCNRINPLKTSGANQRWRQVPAAWGPGSPTTVGDDAGASTNVWSLTQPAVRREETGDPRFGRSHALLAQLQHPLGPPCLCRAGGGIPLRMNRDGTPWSADQIGVLLLKSEGLWVLLKYQTELWATSTGPRV